MLERERSSAISIARHFSQPDLQEYHTLVTGGCDLLRDVRKECESIKDENEQGETNLDKQKQVLWQICWSAQMAYQCFANWVPLQQRWLRP